MNKKNCIKILSNEDETKIVYLSVEDSKKIMERIFSNEKNSIKFKQIIETIFRNNSNKSLYEKYKDYPGTGAIKLSKGRENIRIYCKVETISNNKSKKVQHITLSKIHHKKGESLSKKEENILNAIQKISYEYKQW